MGSERLFEVRRRAACVWAPCRGDRREISKTPAIPTTTPLPTERTARRPSHPLSPVVTSHIVFGERDEGKRDRSGPQFGVPRVRNPLERAAPCELRTRSTRHTYPPHFSRLFLRAFVNDAASRAQVDVESGLLVRYRRTNYFGSSGCRCARSLPLAQPPSTHPSLDVCMCPSPFLSSPSLAQLHSKKLVLLSTPKAKGLRSCARACSVCLVVVRVVLVLLDDIR